LSETANLSALVIRNIGDLAAAMKQASEVIEPRVWQELGARLKKELPADTWHVNVADEDLWFADRQWSGPELALPGVNFWLALGECVQPGRDAEDTWLPVFTGSGPAGAHLALFFEQKLVGTGAWKKLLKAGGDHLAALEASGFRRDPGNSQLYMPVLIDNDALARAFEEEDFDEVLEPLTKVIAAVSRSRRALAAFVEALRAKADS
jgi:hypothetical protein